MIASSNTIRKENAHDLFKLHPDRVQIEAVIAAGTPTHTLLSLYPFDIAEYAPEVTERLASHKDFNLFSSNILKLYEGWDTEAKVLKLSSSIERHERDWRLHEESYGVLLTVLETRLSKNLAWTPPTFHAPAKTPKQKAEAMARAVCIALAYAAYGSVDFELHMSSRLKDIVSHTLIYLTQPEIYGRWGSKHNAR